MHWIWQIRSTCTSCIVSIDIPHHHFSNWSMKLPVDSTALTGLMLLRCILWEMLHHWNKRGTVPSNCNSWVSVRAAQFWSDLDGFADLFQWKSRTWFDSDVDNGKYPSWELAYPTLGKRKVIFKSALGWDMWVPWRVFLESGLGYFWTFQFGDSEIFSGAKGSESEIHICPWNTSNERWI